MIRITEVRVTPQKEARLRGYATVTLADCFVIRGLKVIAGKSGRLFVAMPSRKKPDGTYQDIAHPITPEFRLLLETAVIQEYNSALRAGSEQGRGKEPPLSLSG
jgi:stage V sporulation protein G